jgi:quercetin dioxygenase-like cupin family protein
VIVELADWDLPQVFGNVARRRLTFVGKQVLPAHEHNFAHAHIVIRGTIRCTLKDANGVVSVHDYAAPAMFEVPARLGHQLESVTDGAEGWCIFAVRDEDGGVAYEVTDAHRKDRFWNERLGGGD